MPEIGCTLKKKKQQQQSNYIKPVPGNIGLRSVLIQHIGFTVLITNPKDQSCGVLLPQEVSLLSAQAITWK